MSIRTVTEYEHKTYSVNILKLFFGSQTRIRIQFFCSLQQLDQNSGVMCSNQSWVHTLQLVSQDTSGLQFKMNVSYLTQGKKLPNNFLVMLFRDKLCLL